MAHLTLIGYYQNDGKIKNCDWYRNGKLTEQSTTEYLTEFQREIFTVGKIRMAKRMEL
jgi:hypothetical protein